MNESPRSETETAEAAGQQTATSWEPRIVAFICNWCTYTGADLAGTSRMKYPPYVRVIKIPCTGRFDPLFMIKAFERGADGVLVSGCHPGDCHYTAGNYNARRKYTVFKSLLETLGMDTGRVWFSWISASEGGKWVETIRKFTDVIREKGPFQEYREMIDAG
jgi:F420-non-reducing hydrogenase iron-sulfur subunit